MALVVKENLRVTLSWLVLGPEERKPCRDRHYYAVKVLVSLGIMVAMLMPVDWEHLALPLALAANLLWIWLDP